MRAQAQVDYRHLGDREIAAGVARRDPVAVRLVTDRNNQRLFRAAWSILGNRAEAEDAVQDAYLKGFAAIARFDGRSSLSTWLTRIVINEALGRRRAARRWRARLDENSIVAIDEYREKLMRGSAGTASPDQLVAREQLRELMEAAIARLPANFRLIFILREIEGLSIDDTAQALGILPATVKTRLLRARRQLQRALGPEIRSALTGAFPFAGIDCRGLTERVVERFCDDSRPQGDPSDD